LSRANLLQGAYDLHVHAEPDVVPRARNLKEIAAAASRRSMAGILLKDHCTSTVGRAAALNGLAEGPCRFFGGLALNPPVGSLNGTAVEAALRAGVDVVFFPTYGAANHVKVWGAGKPPTAFPLPVGDFRGVTILDGGGQLVEACGPILRMIAAHDAVLATGHISPEESLILLKQAKVCGIRRMLVTHASESVTPWSHEEQQLAVSLGAMIEHCFFAVTASCPNPTSLASILDQIRVIGAEHVILSSDFGQVANGDPVEGFAHYLEKMITLGLSKEALSVMIHENPNKLLAHNRRGRQGDLPAVSK
jgi:Family of unknown function (DUF6282)